MDPDLRAYASELAHDGAESEMDKCERCAAKEPRTCLVTVVDVHYRFNVCPGWHMLDDWLLNPKLWARIDPTWR